MSTPVQGQIIAGKYRLERPLARGGMGSVWVARHIALDADVAVKLIVPERSELDRRPRPLRARGQGRAPSSAAPTSCRCYDYGVEDDTPFIVMELLEGEDLARAPRAREATLARRHRHRAGPRLQGPPARPRGRARPPRPQAGQHLPRQHGDDEEIAKILDFGIAKAPALDVSGSATRTGALLGSPHYMSPEQVRSGKHGRPPHRPLVASAVIAFRCLTGRAAVHGRARSATSSSRSAPSPSRRRPRGRPELGPDVDRFFERALSRDLDRRFQSARELGEALSALAFGMSEQAISISASVPPFAATEVLADMSTAAAEDSELGTSDPDPDASTLRDTTTETTVEPPEPALPPPPAPRPRRWPLAALALAAMLAGGAAAVGVHLAVRRREPAPLPHRRAAARTTGRASPRARASQRFAARTTGCACRSRPIECKVLAGPRDVENDATVWVGAMFPIKGQDPESYGPRAANAIDLARRDFAETVGGVPSLSPGRAARPLGVVLCDDHESPARAAEHLVNDLRVPAVVGFARSKEVLDLATSLFVPKGVLALASNTASMLRDVPGVPGSRGCSSGRRRATTWSRPPRRPCSKR